MLLDKRSFAVVHAASTDETRLVLNGVLIGPDGSTVATDGHILAEISPCTEFDEADFPMREGAAPAWTPEGEGVVVPAEVCKKAAKLPSKKKFHLPILNAIQLCKNGNGPEFMATDLDTESRAAFRPLEGPFPNYRQVIPRNLDEAKIRIGFSVAVLEKAIKIAKEFSEDAPQNTTMEFFLFDPKKAVVVKVRTGWQHRGLQFVIAPDVEPEGGAVQNDRTCDIVTMPMRLPEEAK
jgi:hypothetical protein